jgi:hypothetical protein
MRRREFIMLVGGAALAWPQVVCAQQGGKLPTIGCLGLASASQHAYGGSDAFLAGLPPKGE